MSKSLARAAADVLDSIPASYLLNWGLSVSGAVHRFLLHGERGGEKGITGYERETLCFGGGVCRDTASTFSFTDGSALKVFFPPKAGDFQVTYRVVEKRATE